MTVSDVQRRIPLIEPYLRPDGIEYYVSPILARPGGIYGVVHPCPGFEILDEERGDEFAFGTEDPDGFLITGQRGVAGVLVRHARILGRALGVVFPEICGSAPGTAACQITELADVVGPIVVVVVEIPVEIQRVVVIFFRRTIIHSVLLVGHIRCDAASYHIRCRRMLGNGAGNANTSVEHPVHSAADT